LYSDGTPMCRFMVPPSTRNEWRAKLVTAKQSFDWSKQLVNFIWARAQERWLLGDRPDVRPLIPERALHENLGVDHKIVTMQESDPQVICFLLLKFPV